MHDDDIFKELMSSLGGKPWENNIELHEFAPRAAVSVWEDDIVVWFGTVNTAVTDSGGYSGEIAVGRSASGRRVTELDPANLGIEFVSLVLPTSMFAGELAFDVWEVWAQFNALKMHGWLDHIPEEHLHAETIEYVRDRIRSNEVEKKARMTRMTARVNTEGTRVQKSAAEFVRFLNSEDDFLTVLALFRNHLRRTVG